MGAKAEVPPGVGAVEGEVGGGEASYPASLTLDHWCVREAQDMTHTSTLYGKKHLDLSI